MLEGLSTPTNTQASPTAFPLPPLLRPFETGVWVWAPLVANVANLILAHNMWGRAARECTALADALAAAGPPARTRLRLLARYAVQVGFRGAMRGV
jgi:hypothetical protein